MSDRPIHWHEGMFLRPHHFQAADRHMRQFIGQQVRWDEHHYWGVRHLKHDPDALGAFRFVVRHLEARMRDGTPVVLPDDAGEQGLDLKEAFQRQSRVEIFLAVPQWRSGQPNAGPDVQFPRYLVDNLALEDENTGVNPQPVSVRRPNVRLMFGDDDHAGFETLPLARLVKADRAEATPKLDTTFIPPLLACDGWPVLSDDILQQVFFRINTKIEVLASQVKSRGISFDSGSPGDGRRMHQLARLNEAHALLSNMAFVPGVHPLPAYLELCRIVGQLSILGEAVRPPDLPRYDHEDLGTCFWKVKQYIDALLSDVEEPAYQERPFIGAGLRMQVAIEPAWLEPAWTMFLGVKSTLSNEECIRMLTRPEKLGMKIGSSDRVDVIFTRGQDGLKFAACPRPPRDLPSAPNLTYFDMPRDTNNPEWQNIQRSLSVAIRIREGDIIGNIQGQRELTIRVGGQTTTMQFTLFMVPATAARGQ
jgi:type VI secretion system protein ImpJ